MPNENDFQTWIDYRNAGGKLSYTEWVQQAKPGVPVEKAFRWPWETVAGEGFIAPWTQQVAVPTQEGIRYRQPMTLAERQAAAIVLPGPPPTTPPEPEEPSPFGKPPVTWRTISEGGWLFSVGYDEDGRVVMRNPLGRAEEPGMTEAQKRAADLARERFEFERQQTLLAGQPQPISPYEQAQLELARQRMAMEQQMAGPQPISPYQQAQVGLQQQQFGLQQQQFEAQQQQFQQQLEFQQAQAQAAQQEQEQRYRAQLAAQPINWLQYRAYTGDAPLGRPWMVPLGMEASQVGLPIPGFQAGQAGQQGIQTFAGLPQLRTPSAQLQARWGPTAQAQFLGYRQARTGATPEETQFRLGAGRAPAGRFPGFSRFR